MGLAASQARFLELTARKNDNEYQGQQVNQQRTSLATQSATLFNKMLALTVPTVPTYSDYADDTAYEAALEEYEIEKAAYDKSLDDLNAQTEQIQQNDKVLEIKLKQLDSDHNAVQTELEAVKKVIEKNIESTFKTFA